MADAQPSVVQGAFKQPFAGQVAFFRNKLGHLIPTVKWDDISKSAHDRGFMVAGAAKADLLADLAAAVDRSISEGKSIEAFRKDFRAIVQKRGWHGWKGEGTAAGEAWRTRIIFQTNMNTAYNAGRLAQLRQAGFPFWIYHHNDSVSSPRPLHQAWQGIVLPSDAPWWKTHYTPNGWGCRCYITGAHSKAAAKLVGGNPDKKPDPAWNKTDAKTGAPVGIDKGWDYMPGDTVSDTVSALAKKTATLPPEIAVAFGATIGTQIVQSYAQWVDEVLADRVTRGRSAVLGVMREAELSYLAKVGKRPDRTDISLADRLIVGKKAKRHEMTGNALTDVEWASLAGAMQKPAAILYDNDSGNVLYVLPSAGDDTIKIVVTPNYWDKKARQSINSTRSVFKVGKIALQDRKKYTVIDGKI